MKVQAHVVDDVIFDVFMFITECLTFNRNLGVDANLTLGRAVAGFPIWSWGYLWPLFLSFLLRWDGLHWVSPSCTICGVLDAICFSHCLAKDVAAPGFPWLHHQGILRRDRLLSSALVRHFLRVVKDQGVTFLFLRLAHWSSLSSTLSRDNLFDSITFVSVPTDDFANIGWHRRRRLCWVWWVCLWQLVTVNQPCSMIEVVWVTFAVQTTIAWTWVWQLLKQIFGQPEYVRDPCKCLCAFFARVGGFCLLNSTKFSEDSVIGPSRNYEDSRVAVMTLPNSSFSRSTMLREWGKRCASHGM